MEMWLIRLRFNGQSLACLSEKENPEEAVSEVRKSLNALLKTEDANLRILAVLRVQVTGEALGVAKS